MSVQNISNPCQDWSFLYSLAALLSYRFSWSMNSQWAGGEEEKSWVWFGITQCHRSLSFSLRWEPRDGFWRELWRAGRCQMLREVKYWLFLGKYHQARHLKGLIPPDALDSPSSRLSCSFVTSLWYPKNAPRGFQMSPSTGHVYQPVGTGHLQRCARVITQTRLSK